MNRQILIYGGACAIVYDTRKDLQCEGLHDLVVMPKFQNQEIGKELVRKCREYFLDSEWLVETEAATGFYEKIGFKSDKDIFLSIPCKWF